MRACACTHRCAHVCKSCASRPGLFGTDTWQASQDTRTQNSWTQELGDISGEEAAEVHAINALAPFIINSALKPLLLACDEGEHWVTLMLPIVLPHQ